MEDKTVSKKYKLYCFDDFGLSEPIRYLLCFCGIPFENTRMDVVEEWFPTYKAAMPIKQAPVLEIDGVKYHQHLAICRYIARKNNLCGSTEEEACEMDALVQDMTGIHLEVGKWFKEQNFSLKDKMKEKLLKDLAFFLRKFDTRIEANNGYFVGAEISWVDIYFSAIIQQMSKLMKEDLNKQEDYPNSRDLAYRIRTHMMIAPHIH